MLVALAALACAGVAACAAAGAVPLPTAPVGRGTEPTAGGAIVSGKRVAMRSALIWVDGFGDLTLQLTRRPRSCSAPAAAAWPYVWAWVHSGARTLPVGRPVTRSAATRVVLNLVAAGALRPVTLTRGVRLVFTRVDTRAGGVWHGRLSASPASVGGGRFGYSGTFAARWCGQR